MDLIWNEMYKLILTYTYYREGNAIDFLSIFASFVFITGVYITINSFKYPVLYKYGTLADSFENSFNITNNSGHKSLVIDFFTGLAFMGIFIKLFTYITFLYVLILISMLKFLKVI